MKSITPVMCIFATYATMPGNMTTRHPNHTIVNSHFSVAHQKTLPISSLPGQSRFAQRYIGTLISHKNYESSSKQLPELLCDCSQGMLCFTLQAEHGMDKAQKYLQRLTQSTDPFPLLDQLPLCAKKEPHTCNITRCIKILFSHTHFSGTKQQHMLYSNLVLRALKQEAHCSLRQLHVFKHLISLDLINEIAQHINQHYKVEHFINALPFGQALFANCLYNEILKTSLCDIGKDTCDVITQFVGNGYFFSLLSKTRTAELKQQLLSEQHIDLGERIEFLTAEDIQNSKMQ